MLLISSLRSAAARPHGRPAFASRSRRPRHPRASAFTLIEMMVVLIILGSMASAGIGLLSQSMDMARSRAASDRLYYLLQREQFAARTRNDATQSYGVAIMRGTIMQGNSIVDGISLIPWQTTDPFHAIAKPSHVLFPVSTLNTQEKTELITLDPAVYFVKQWVAGNAYPPAPMLNTTFIAFNNLGNVDLPNTTTANLNSYNAVPTFANGVVYEFDIVADWGYQRFRINTYGQVDRSVWNDLATAAPQSVSYGNF